MPRALQIAQLCTLLAVIVFLGVIGHRLCGTLDGLRVAENQLNIALEKINQPRIGILAGINAAIGNLDAATGQWAAASKQQAASVSAIEGDVRAELWHVDRMLTTADSTLGAVTGTANAVTGAANEAINTIAAFKPLLAALTVDAKSLQPTEVALTDLIDEAKPVVVNGGRIVKDGADEADKFAHPPKKKLTRWGIIETIVLWIHRVEPPIL